MKKILNLIIRLRRKFILACTNNFRKLFGALLARALNAKILCFVSSWQSKCFLRWAIYIKKYQHTLGQCNSKGWEHPQCLSARNWLSKPWYVCSMEYKCSWTKNVEVLYAAIWKDLQDILLSEKKKSKEWFLTYAPTYVSKGEKENVHS